MKYSVFCSNREKNYIGAKKKHEKVGLWVTWTAYTAIKEGKRGTFFGELNNSLEFHRDLMKNVYYVNQNLWIWVLKII